MKMHSKHPRRDLRSPVETNPQHNINENNSLSLWRLHFLSNSCGARCRERSDPLWPPDHFDCKPPCSNFRDGLYRNFKCAVINDIQLRQNLKKREPGNFISPASPSQVQPWQGIRSGNPFRLSLAFFCQMKVHIVHNMIVELEYEA